MKALMLISIIWLSKYITIALLELLSKDKNRFIPLREFLAQIYLIYTMFTVVMLHVRHNIKRPDVPMPDEKVDELIGKYIYYRF